MKKEHITFEIASSNLQVNDIALREYEDDNRIQFILKNTSNTTYRIDDVELKLFDSLGKYIGHETNCWIFDKFIKKKDEKLLEFDLGTFTNIKSAKIRIKSTRYYNSDNFIVALFIIVPLIVIFLYKLAQV